MALAAVDEAMRIEAAPERRRQAKEVRSIFDSAILSLDLPDDQEEPRPSGQDAMGRYRLTDVSPDLLFGDPEGGQGAGTFNQPEAVTHAGAKSKSATKGGKALGGKKGRRTWRVRRRSDNLPRSLHAIPRRRGRTSRHATPDGPFAAPQPGPGTIRDARGAPSGSAIAPCRCCSRWEWQRPRRAGPGARPATTTGSTDAAGVGADQLR